MSYFEEGAKAYITHTWAAEHSTAMVNVAIRIKELWTIMSLNIIQDKYCMNSYEQLHQKKKTRMNNTWKKTIAKGSIVNTRASICWNKKSDKNKITFFL